MSFPVIYMTTQEYIKKKNTCTVQYFGGSLVYFINSFIEQGCIKLAKSDSKEICYKKTYFK